MHAVSYLLLLQTYLILYPPVTENGPCVVILLFIGCVKDKNLGYSEYAIQDRSCKEKYTCAKLAKGNRCNQNFGQAMEQSCSQKLKQWWRNQKVNMRCKKSCNQCTRKF